MRFDLLQSLSIAGDAHTPNDDRIGCTGRLAWVIDGATDLGPPGLVGTQGGAAWIADAANTAFAQVDDGSIDAICAHVFAQVQRRYAAAQQRDALGRWELPSAAFLAARAGPHGIELAWAADCTALIRRGEEVARIGPRVDRDPEAASAARFAGHGLGAKQRPAEITAMLRQSRSRLPRHVLGVEPLAREDLGLAVVPAAPGDDVLLMSDGFAALVDSYAALDAEELMASLATRGLVELAFELRAIEAGDAACTRFPRFKRSDDASALWLRVAA